MKIPKVTVIVPVYNSEKHFPACAEALMAQTLDELEIILVDDGSTDSSGKLCDEYAKQDSRIRVIHKSNGGVSAARQTGLDAATGEYVIWADSDDWMKPDMYEKMYDKAKETNADLVICNFTYVYLGHCTKQQFPSQKTITAPELIHLILEGKVQGTAWNKLFLHSSISSEVFFPPDINMYEDLIFNILFLKKNPKIYFFDESFYYYIISNSVITVLRNDATFMNDFHALKFIETILDPSFDGSLQFFRDRIACELVVFRKSIRQNICKLMRDHRLGYHTLSVRKKLYVLSFMYFPVFLPVLDCLYKIKLLSGKKIRIPVFASR